MQTTQYCVGREEIYPAKTVSITLFCIAQPSRILKPYRDVPIALGCPPVDAGFAIHGGRMIRSYAAEPNFPGPEEPVPQPPQPELPPKKPFEPELPSPDPERAPFPGPGPTDPGLPQPIS
jgi:hypothetical protein